MPSEPVPFPSPAGPDSPESAPRPSTPGSFPTVRMRRNRARDWSRRLVAENRLAPEDLIWPVFVHDDAGAVDVPSMPGAQRLSIDLLVEAAGHAAALGIPVIAIFPALDSALKDAEGSEAVNADNLVCRAIRAVAAAVPDIGIMCDVALDPFTNHGHDGVIRDGYVANDETVDILVRQALVQAAAGCTVISPSDMMDGRIGSLRKALDAAGREEVLLLSYAAKYASVFYGPFRDAVGSSTSLGEGDKRTYQMDPANTDEALREVALDIEEGADMVMIKPGMPYLDIVRRVKETFSMPTYVYQVSGEYAMLMAAGERLWLDGEGALMESLLGFKRAGADGILTYAAIRAAKTLNC